MTTKNSSPLFSILIVIIAISSIVGVIIFLKNATSRNISPDGLLHHSTDSIVARPDISNDGSDGQDSNIAQPDTIMGTDARSVSDAGYEDGYWAGYDDAFIQEEHASYDENCSFSTESDRKKYREYYREGYADGWKVGIQDSEKISSENTKE